MDTNPENVIQRLIRYKNEIYEMNDNVMLFLGDRQRYSYPDHEKLIREIRTYENQVHRLSNSSVHMWLDNVMHSLMVYENLWKRAFEEDSLNYSKTSSDEKTDKISRTLGKVFDAVQEKRTKDGRSADTSRDRFIREMRSEYANTLDKLSGDQRIAIVYDSENDKARFIVKEK